MVIVGSKSRRITGLLDSTSNDCAFKWMHLLRERDIGLHIYKQLGLEKKAKGEQGPQYEGKRGSGTTTTDQQTKHNCTLIRLMVRW